MNKLDNFSVAIITCNEQQRLEKTLKAISSITNEIIIVDSYSTDNTKKIAQKYTNNFFKRDFDGFSEQKNYALSKVTKPWVMLLDSDEILTKELQQEIFDLLKNNNLEQKVYAVKFKEMVLGNVLKYTIKQKTKTIRLFPSNLRYSDNLLVHEKLNIKEMPVGKLKHFIYHNSRPDIDIMVNKARQYANLRALEMYKKGVKSSALKMIFKPFIRFITHYIIYGGFLDGMSGFLYSVFVAWEVFLRQVVLYSLWKGNKISVKR